VIVLCTAQWLFEQVSFAVRIILLYFVVLFVSAIFPE
jgi:hypothetical protein